MEVVVPVEIKNANLIETNVPHDDAPEYSDTTQYNPGDEVMIAAEKSVYEHVGASATTGVSPTGDNDTWLRLGATNRWRGFDQTVGTVVAGQYTFDHLVYAVEQDDTYTEGVAMQIRPDTSADTLALFNLSGLHVDIICRTSAGIEYEKRVLLGGQLTDSNWYSYFYEPMERETRIVLTDLPETQDKDIYISIVEPDTNYNAEIGEIAIGRKVPIGRSRYGTSLDFLDFSTKERDQFGNFEIVERGFADDLEVDLLLENNDIYHVKKLITSIRAKPAVWIASECHEFTIVYGYMKNFGIIISGPRYSDASLRIEGLI